MKGYVYILEMRNGQYYVGSTRDIEKRMAKHNSGGVRSTKEKRPLKLIHVKEYRNYNEALKEEIKIKKQKSRSYIEKYIAGLIV